MNLLRKTLKKHYAIPLVMATVIVFLVALSWLYKYVAMNSGDYHKGDLVISEVAGDDMGKNNIKMGESEAFLVAKQSCSRGTRVLSAGVYNKESKTWWFNTVLNKNRTNCKLFCVIDEEEKTAEMNCECSS